MTERKPSPPAQDALDRAVAAGILLEDEITRLRAALAAAEAERERLRGILASLRLRLDTRLNDYLCGMKPDYDDSITGFNEAWDVMRKLFDEAGSAQKPAQRERFPKVNFYVCACGKTLFLEDHRLACEV